MKLCRCGRIVANRCDRCDKSYKTESSRSVVYDNKHRVASEIYRAFHPLCEVCVHDYGVLNANPSKHMHHIVKVRDDESLRMASGNWLAVCVGCHNAIENDAARARVVKNWSSVNYEKVMNK